MSFTFVLTPCSAEGWGVPPDYDFESQRQAPPATLLVLISIQHFGISPFVDSNIQIRTFLISQSIHSHWPFKAVPQCGQCGPSQPLSGVLPFRRNGYFLFDIFWDFVSGIVVVFYHAVLLQKRQAWVLLALLLSSLVCCQPIELILGFCFCFINFPILPPPPLSRCKQP